MLARSGRADQPEGDRPGPGHGLVLVAMRRPWCGAVMTSAAVRPRSGWSRLRQPAGIPAAPGSGPTPAVPRPAAANSGPRCCTIQVASRSVMVAATHLSNKQGTTSASSGSCKGWPGPGGRAAAGGRPGYTLDGAAGGLQARSWPETGRGQPGQFRLSSSTMFCATTRLGWSSRGARGGRRPVSDHRAWWSSSTSRPPDQADNLLRRLTNGGWSWAARRPPPAARGQCRPLGETGPAVAVSAMRTGEEMRMDRGRRPFQFEVIGEAITSRETTAGHGPPSRSARLLNPAAARPLRG